MVEVEIILESYTESDIAAIQSAFKLLQDLQVFTTQVESNKNRISSSFTDSDPLDLAREILEIRQVNRQLLALHELADNLKKGTNDA